MKTHQLGLRCDDATFKLLEEKSGGLLPPGTMASAIFHAGIEAIKREGSFSMPLRFTVAKPTSEKKQAAH